MKIRIGFVSNSSTSSYIVVGAIFESKSELFDSLKEEWKEKFGDEDKMAYELEDSMCDYYGDGSFAFGDRVGSVDYIEEIASVNDLVEAEKSVKEMFKKYLKDENTEINVIGIRAEC